MRVAVVLSILLAVASAEKSLHDKNEADETIDEKVEILMSKIDEHCEAVNHGGLRRKRQSGDALVGVLLRALHSCQLSIVNPTTSAPVVTSSADPCISPSTVNLTGSWRKDRSGSHIKPDNGFYACDRDLQGNAIWFRFTGDAGQQLSNRCAPAYFCGGHGGFWSDAAMPTRVGETRQVPIYGSWKNNCKWYTWPTTNALTVKRCSDASGDFVYKVHGTRSCYWTFCGMDIVN